MGRDICTVCCATKRLTEIRCPSDCRYLASAKRHPPAAEQRQHERDARFLLSVVADLPPQQYQLFFSVQNLLHDVAETVDPPVDDRTVREAAEALARTYDTASKGIIYDHQAPSLPAERVSRTLKPLLDAPGPAGRPPATERELAAVLRCVERAAAGAEEALGSGGRAYLELAGRVARSSPRPAGGPASGRSEETGDEPLVIIP